MSDSASRNDVEDVLSSVRRLVSSEVPRTRRPELPKGPGALVLTDAQRIERPVSKGQAARSLEDRIAELEAAVSSRDDDYEPDGSEDQAQHTPDRIVYTRPPTEAEQEGARADALRLSKLSVVVSEPDEAEDSDDQAAAPVPFRHAAQPETPEPAGETTEENEAPMAEDVDVEPRSRGEVHAFHDPEDMIGRFEARMDGDDRQSPGPGHNGFHERLEPYQPDEAAPEPAEAEQFGDDPADAPADAAADPADAIGDEAFEAALTEAVQQSVEGTVDATNATAAADPAGADDESRDASGAAPLPAGAIDAEALRPIVAQLIREELQGDLGERITRNVRKLVRREILRAINAREFE